MNFIAIFIPSLLFLTSCSSPSLLPKKNNVVVSRETADKDCKELGDIQGRTSTINGGPEEALNDLHQEAANRGANYVQIKQFSGNQTAVNGTAYLCP